MHESKTEAAVHVGAPGDGARRFVVGADIGGTRLRMMLADLQGAPVARWSALLKPGGKTPEAICALARVGLEAMCASAGVAPAAVLHLVAGAPGITNVDAGVVLAAPNLEGWTDVPLRDLLHNATGLPVTAENDVNLAALGEHRHGAARGGESSVFVAVGTGVGAGIILGGAIHHGSNWAAGELGYSGVRGEPWSPLRAQETGQLERRLGGAGLEQRWQALLAGACGSRGIADPAGTSLHLLHAPEIFDRALTGDALALQLLEETALQLADLLTAVALVLDPPLIVLGGGIGAHPALAAATHELLQRSELARPEVRTSSLGAGAQLYGGVALAADRAIQAAP